MEVGIVGAGPAVEAVRGAVSDLGDEQPTLRSGEVTGVDAAVVIGRTGADDFDRANTSGLASGMPWFAVEIGGLGGIAVGIEAGVAGFGPETACFDCLRRRVRANHSDADTEAAGATPGPAIERFAGAIAGRALVQVCQTGRAALLGGVVEVPHAERRLLRVPGCDCSPAREAALSLTHESRSLDETVERAERGLDSRVGIVTEVGEAESFPVPYYLATLASTDGFSDASVPRQTAGVSADWNAAFVKALGEAFERYSAAVYRDDWFTVGPPGGLANAIPPERFVSPVADETPAPQADMEWLPGQHLRDGSAVHVPADVVLFPPPREGVRPATTTGLGLGTTPVDAVLAGLYETIERDAVMLGWYSTYDPLAIAVDDDRYATLVRRARSEDLEVTALLMTQDVDVPVVVVAVHREGEWPRFATGMGAHLDPDRAARAALEEALQNWMELRGMGRDAALDASGAIGRYAAFPPAAREFVNTPATVPASDLGPDPVPAGTDELTAVLDRVAEAGLTAYAVRLTPPDVEAMGFETVRVLIPEAQPLFTDEPYFGDRADTVPRGLGFEPRHDRDHHPFP